MRTAARSEPRRGDAVSSSSPAGSKLRASVDRSAGRAWSRRPTSRISARRSSAMAVWRRTTASSVSTTSMNWSGSRRPPRTARPTSGSMSLAPPIPTPGRSDRSWRAWSVSSSPRATITGSDEGSSASAIRRDGSKDVCAARRSRTCGNSSSAIERASIRGCAGSATCCPPRRGAMAGWSRARPRTRCRSAGQSRSRAEAHPAGRTRGAARRWDRRGRSR